MLLFATGGDRSHRPPQLSNVRFLSRVKHIVHPSRVTCNVTCSVNAPVLWRISRRTSCISRKLLIESGSHAVEAFITEARTRLHPSRGLGRTFARPLATCLARVWGAVTVFAAVERLDFYETHLESGNGSSLETMVSGWVLTVQPDEQTILVVRISRASR